MNNKEKMPYKKHEKGLCLTPYWYLLKLMLGLPRWLSDKESACQAGDVGLIPELGRSPGKEMTIHSSILAWEIPWAEKSGRLQSIGSQRIGHDLVTKQHYMGEKMHLDPYPMLYIKIKLKWVIDSCKSWSYKAYIFVSAGQSIGTSASVLPMNIQC